MDSFKKIRQDASKFLDVSRRYQGDKVYVSRALQNNYKVLYTILNDCPKHQLELDWDLVVTAATADVRALLCVPSCWLNDYHVRQDFLKRVKEDSCCREIVCDVYPNDKEIALVVLKKDGSFLRRYPEHMQDDKRLAMAAVGEHAESFLHVSNRLRNDRSFTLAATKRNAKCFEYVSHRFKKDKEIALAAVTTIGLAVLDVSDQLKRDPDVVLAAVRQNCQALLFVSSTLCEDVKVMSAVVEQDPSFKVYARGAALASKEFLLASLRADGLLLQYAKENARSTPDIVMVALQQNGEALRYASKEMRGSAKVVEVAIRNNGCAIRFASPELQASRDLFMLAVQQNGRALQFGCKDIKHDRELVMTAIEQCGEAFRYVPHAFCLDRNVAMAALQRWDGAFEFVPNVLLVYRDIVLKAVQHRGNILVGDRVPSGFRLDMEVVGAAIRNCPSLFNNHRFGDLRNSLSRIMPWLERQERMMNTTFNFRDLDHHPCGTAATDVAKQVKHRHRVAMWLLGQQFSGQPDTVRSIMDYLDTTNDFRMAKLLIHVAPIFSALAYHGMGWRDLGRDLGRAPLEQYLGHMLGPVDLELVWQQILALSLPPS